MRNDARPIGPMSPMNEDVRGYRGATARGASDANRRERERESIMHREPRAESNDRQRRKGDTAPARDKKPFITDRDPGDEEPALPSNDASLKTRI
jgi:hypothetical protein